LHSQYCTDPSTKLAAVAAIIGAALFCQTYLRNEGVKSLSYNAAGQSQIAGGDSVQALEDELAGRTTVVD